jgi:hypothetical protein
MEFQEGDTLFGCGCCLVLLDDLISYVSSVERFSCSHRGFNALKEFRHRHGLALNSTLLGDIGLSSRKSEVVSRVEVSESAQVSITPTPCHGGAMDRAGRVVNAYC